MERDRRTAMRLRAKMAMDAALAAADACAPSLVMFIEDAMTSIDLVWRDGALDPGDRLILIEDMLVLIGSLKRLSKAAPADRPGLIMEAGRRTNGLLRRYARLVR